MPVADRSLRQRCRADLTGSARLVVVVGACLLMLGVLAPTAVWAQDDVTSTTLGSTPEGGGIIPKPNSGVEPTDAGDRGGALQTVLFVAMIGGVAAIGLLVVRESRSKRAERGY